MLPCVAMPPTRATPSTEWKETVPAGEETRHLSYAEAFRAIQRSRARGGRVRRALHAKANCGVEGELAVLGDLPEYARAGLFVEPRTYRAYVRYSNGDGRRNADGRGDVRGIAIKVVGVEGTKVIHGMEREKTQDFLLIRTPTIPFRDADEFAAVVTAAQKSSLLFLPRVVARLGLGRTFELLPKLAKGLKQPMLSLATTRYFSAAPIRCGAFAIRYALAPQTEPESSLVPGRSPDYLREELAARLAIGPVMYELRVQFYVDETLTPIEDASVEWKEEDAPFVTVARLTLPKQDLDGASRGSRTTRGMPSKHTARSAT